MSESQAIAWKQGHEAGMPHDGVRDNPYDRESNPKLRVAWDTGFDAAVVKGENAVNPFASEAPDAVNHPSHYTSGPKCECGRVIECITITRERNFDIGNAIKYLWRAGKKSDSATTAREKEIEDLRKAEFYIRDEIQRLEKLKEEA